MSFINFKKPNGKFWYNFNLVINGKLVFLNVLGFIIMVFVHIFNQNMVNLTMWTANLAGMNAGVISVIWSITPLLQGVVDSIMIKQ